MKIKNIYKIGVLMVVLELFIKFLGFIKQSFIAFYYGTSESLDAYFVASDFINGLSNAIIVSLRVAIISVYTAIRIKKGLEEGKKVISSIIETLIPISVIMFLFMYIFSDSIGVMLAPSFSVMQHSYLEMYIRKLSGVILLTMMCMIYDAILNSNEVYIVSKFRSLIYSVLIIVACSLFSQKYGITALLYCQYGALIGYFVIQKISSNKFYKFRFEKKIDVVLLKKMFCLMIPVFLGNSIQQINRMVDNAIASGLEEGTVSALSYCHVLDEFFLGVGITSIITILFPHFSVLIAKGDNKKAEEVLMNMMSIMLIVLIPISVIILFCSKDIVTIAFFRGAYTESAMITTSIALCGYAIRYPFVAIRDICIQGLYAKEKMREPMLSAIISVIINIVISFSFVGKFGIFAITIGTSVSAIVGMSMNIYFLKREMVDIKFNMLSNYVKRMIIPLFICVIYMICFGGVLKKIPNIVIRLGAVTLTNYIIFIIGLFIFGESTIKKLIYKIVGRKEVE